jgi:hypothetical protein
MNEKYPVNDKRILAVVVGFAILPNEFSSRMGRLLPHPGFEPDELRATLAKLRALFAETVALTDGAYQPKFRLPSG